MDPSLPLLIVISAPSGGGKTTLCDQLLARHANITRAITCTTRPPRAEERDGEHYFFLSPAAFRAQVAAGAFLEHASVYDNSYGTLNSEVLAKLDSGQHVLLNIDVQGAGSVRLAAARNPLFRGRLVSVFLTPPTLADLKARLARRNSETPEALALRLEQAGREVAEWKHFDYLIISTTIAEDLRRMESVLEAELMRQPRSAPPQF